MSSPADPPSNESGPVEAGSSHVPVPERPPAALWQLAAGLAIVVFTGAASLIFFEGIAQSIDLQPGPTRDLWALVAGLTGTWVGLFLATILPFAMDKGDMGKALGLRIRPKVDIPLGIAAGLLGQYVIIPLTYAPVALFDPEIFTDVGRKANELAELAVGWGVIPFVLSTCLFAPLFEELFFRGLLFRSLLVRWGPAISVIVSGLVFGLFHADPLLLAGLALFGMLLAFIALRTGRVGACVIAHIAFNSATVVTTVFLR